MVGGNGSLQRGLLALQCPPAFASGEHVSCPWFSNACGPRWHARVLAMGDAAATFQREGLLPPRQLLNAERCASSVCLRHRGYARKPTRKKQAPVDLSPPFALSYALEAESGDG